MSKQPKIALIDANALIHRAYHALPPMSTKEGTPTQAVYGFTAMLLKMFSTLKPTHVAAAFDVPGPTFRHKEYEHYKATRKPAPPDLIEQFDTVREVLRAFNIPILQLTGFEADDIIGTLVKQLGNDKIKKVIVTGDMDTLQLVDDSTAIFTLKRGVTDTITYDRQTIIEKFGFGPEHVVDYKGLRGDPSDNIPGVAGVGDKTARELVAAYGSIEEIFEHLKELSPRVQKRLTGHKKEALFSKRLATIRQDVPIEFSLDAARLEEYDANDVSRLFTKLEFRSLLQRLPKGGTTIQPTLYDGNDSTSEAKLPDNYFIVSSASETKALKAILQAADVIAFDTENDYLGAREYPIVGMSFAAKVSGRIRAWYVPVTPESVKSWRDILEDASIKKVGHNLKYDWEVLQQSEVTLKGIHFDSMLAGYLLNPGSRQFSLDDMALTELNYRTIPLSALLDKKNKAARVSDIPPLELARYAAEDAEVALRLFDKLAPKIKSEKLEGVLNDIEIPLIAVLAKMELNGVAVDKIVLKKLHTKLVRKLAKLEETIWQLAGGKFNINSTQQLRVILFEKLNLPTTHIKRTQTGYSTAAPELEKLRGEHKIIDNIVSYRELTKLLNTYIDTLPQLINKKTGRIYASFNQVVAATGRLSCLPAGTLVNTGRGLIGIEEIFVGDFVHTPEGKRKVLAHQLTGPKQTIMLKLDNGIEISCSPEHKFRSLGKWVTASELQRGSPLYMTYKQGLFGTEKKLKSSSRSAYRTRKSPTIPKEWSVELAELVGYFMADGHIAKSNYNGKPCKVILAFGWDDKELINRYEKIIIKFFGKSPTFRETKSCPVLEVSGVDIGGFLEDIGAGGKSGEIQVPPSLFKAPKQIVASFLRGYFEGDGFVSKQINVRSVSYIMLQGVQQLLAMFGVPSRLSPGQHDPLGHAPRHTLRINSDRGRVVFARDINFVSIRKRKLSGKYAAQAKYNLRRGRKTGTIKEIITLPLEFNANEFKQAFYSIFRGQGIPIPQAAYVQASKFVNGSTIGQTMALPFMEKVVGDIAVPLSVSYPKCRFLEEAVEYQYFEVKVQDIRHDQQQPMYDITVEDTENYFAQGVLVHNSNDPNLQNIPVRTELGQEIRRAFVAERGNLLVKADYSQIELRLAAHLSQDKRMIEVFRAGEDIHRATAAWVHGIDISKVTSAQRREAKTLNFGVLYGMGPQKFALTSGLSMEEARSFIGRYYDQYPQLTAYIDTTINYAKDKGYVATLFGRKRYLPEINSSAPVIRAQAERIAFNFPLQGTAADILKKAMIVLQEDLAARFPDSRLILTVHDELVVEVPAKQASDLARTMKKSMEGVIKLDVPLEVEVSKGPNWRDMTTAL